MDRLAIESTNLASAAYSSERSLLEVEFRDGAVYQFFDVPAVCFEQLLASDSKGVFFNRNIRSHFRFQRLRGSG
jgi:hypothetical protein